MRRGRWRKMEIRKGGEQQRRGKGKSGVERASRKKRKRGCECKRDNQ